MAHSFTRRVVVPRVASALVAGAAIVIGVSILGAGGAAACLDGHDGGDHPVDVPVDQPVVDVAVVDPDVVVPDAPLPVAPDPDVVVPDAPLVDPDGPIVVDVPSFPMPIVVAEVPFVEPVVEPVSEPAVEPAAAPLLATTGATTDRLATVGIGLVTAGLGALAVGRRRRIV